MGTNAYVNVEIGYAFFALFGGLTIVTWLLDGTCLTTDAAFSIAFRFGTS